jgi:hypothetical protein
MLSYTHIAYLIFYLNFTRRDARRIPWRRERCDKSKDGKCFIKLRVSFLPPWRRSHLFLLQHLRDGLSLTKRDRLLILTCSLFGRPSCAVTSCLYFHFSVHGPCARSIILRTEDRTSNNYFFTAKFMLEFSRTFIVPCGCCPVPHTELRYKIC